MALTFDNRFLAELPGDPEMGHRRRDVRGAAWSRVMPEPVSSPRLLAYSQEMAARLSLSENDLHAGGWLQVLAGNAVFPGMDPFASNYGGHQFGTWAGQLGDGRAISLCEVVTAAGERWELQLKGAGPTPYARFADGRAVLRSSIREFLCSEAMHHLGVPTTRALSLVLTGEEIVRDMFYDGHPRTEPGAVVCRVAPSFLRFGHFELPAMRGEIDLLRRLTDFAIARDFSELRGVAGSQALYADWFADVCVRAARMIAEWMRVGFVHGVMNTDNMSILGLTLDYGPYGWIDDFDSDWTPNTTDAQGRRYRFGWQPMVARWNLARLAQALSPLFEDHAALQSGIERFDQVYAETERGNNARKLGLEDWRDGDTDLVRELYALMQESGADMSLLFRSLTDIDPSAPSFQALADCFYDPDRRDAAGGRWSNWLRGYAARLATQALPEAVRRARMQAANPKYVLRNYLAQEAIDRAEQGDPDGVNELLDLLRRPYDEQPDREHFARKRPEWARHRAGCSMLSCSS
ncbi:MAG: YdiU family protein [Lysobacteraceae bacterium]|nr:MAG: YdiU family protein [Xanthomonadaceae bacterium]